ncbi:MAG: sigma-54-dependent Fis family transcriptional regulator [Planctomycetes bacterium]|nr:sigma-54-dependent Fis family transcriptional regulator [Planctomycetota bacterium]MBI3844855.1 sigma-54-dependent Fis family transcriptional regulator [Planctomycetota bacterium]
MPYALVVEDDPSSLKGLLELLQNEGFTTGSADSLQAAREQLAARIPDVVLIDLNLPDGNGMALLENLEEASGTDVILITGHASVDTAVEALRIGVRDYLTKPVDVSRLKAILANVARTRELVEEIGSLRGELRKLGRFGTLIGASPAMQRVYDVVSRVGPTEASVLIVGQSGTGKELIAETLHAVSRRRKGPFLPMNCGAVPATLIESELFGHERGSFTGANRAHKGYFERSMGGTLFLDEITEMPAELQVNLLRVLETRNFIRVGGDEQTTVDVRILAATNRKPEEAVAEGKLRQDLFYRLEVMRIDVPPLCERGDDVTLLATHFLDEMNKAEGTTKRLSKKALERLQAHNWPGNVRELKNILYRAFILADEEIGPERFPFEVHGTNGNSGQDLHFNVGTSIAEAERRLILATLEHYSGSKKKTAEVLGVSLKTLYNRLNTYLLE